MNSKLLENRHMATKYVGFSDLPDAPSSGGGKYMKWVQGNNRVRIVSTAIQHKNKWGKTVWSCLMIDGTDSIMKIGSFGSSVFKALKSFAKENVDPAAADAPSFNITRDGAGLETRYSVTAGMKTAPIPLGLDIPAGLIALESYVAKSNAEAANADQE